MESFGEIAHIALAGGEALQHRPPRGVGEGVEDRIEGRVLFNHMVEYSRPAAIFNRSAELFFGEGSVVKQPGAQTCAIVLARGTPPRAQS
ncbi:MAG: hypothetical protein K8F62_08055 [Pseudorhodoplanes sp.]|nr:hypothetical protein [Pseudorhodoplanes sp.]